MSINRVHKSRIRAHPLRRRPTEITAFHRFVYFLVKVTAHIVHKQLTGSRQHPASEWIAKSRRPYLPAIAHETNKRIIARHEIRICSWVDAQYLALQLRQVLRQRRIARVANSDIQHAVRAELKHPAVVISWSRCRNPVDQDALASWVRHIWVRRARGKAAQAVERSRRVLMRVVHIEKPIR